MHVSTDHVSHEEIPVVRRCCLKVWPDFSGYGFDLLPDETLDDADNDSPINLNLIETLEGHLVAKVDPGSPSAEAGLRKFDRIIEVNRVNVENKSHPEVLASIKEFPTGCKLLVVNAADYKYFLKNRIPIHGNMENITEIYCPEEMVRKNFVVDRPEHMVRENIIVDGPEHIVRDNIMVVDRPEHIVTESVIVDRPEHMVRENIKVVEHPENMVRGNIKVIESTEHMASLGKRLSMHPNRSFLFAVCRVAYKKQTTNQG